MSLSAFSLPSFAGGIAGVASGLLFCFRGGFPRDPLSEFRIAGLLLGFQGGLTSGSLGGQISSLTSFNGQLGGCSLSDTGIASHPDRLPRRSLLDSGRALGRRPRSGARAARSSWAFFAFAAALRRSAKLVFLGPLILSNTLKVAVQGSAVSAAAWQLEAKRTCDPQAHHTGVNDRFSRIYGRRAAVFASAGRRRRCLTSLRSRTH